MLGMLMPKEPEVELSTSPGHKRPKDDRIVIEELHTLNTQLRAFISQLLGQLEASEKQVRVYCEMELNLKLLYSLAEVRTGTASLLSTT